MKLPLLRTIYSLLLLPTAINAQTFEVKGGLHSQLVTQEPVNSWLAGNDTWDIEPSPEADGLFVWSTPNSDPANITAYTDSYVYRFTVVPSKEKHTSLITVKGNQRVQTKSVASTEKEFSPLAKMLKAAKSPNLSEMLPQTSSLQQPPVVRNHTAQAITSVITPITEPVRVTDQDNKKDALSIASVTKTTPSTQTIVKPGHAAIQTTVGIGDTLASVTKRLFSGESVGDKHYSAVFNLNKQSFIKHNPNLIRKGGVIEKPSPAQVSQARTIEWSKKETTARAPITAAVPQVALDPKEDRYISTLKETVERLERDNQQATATKSELLERLSNLEAALEETKNIIRG